MSNECMRITILIIYSSVYLYSIRLYSQKYARIKYMIFVLHSKQKFSHINLNKVLRIVKKEENIKRNVWYQKSKQKCNETLRFTHVNTFIFSLNLFNVKAMLNFNATLMFCNSYTSFSSSIFLTLKWHYIFNVTLKKL